MPTACGSHQCHRSPPRSVAPPLPVIVWGFYISFFEICLLILRINAVCAMCIHKFILFCSFFFLSNNALNIYIKQFPKRGKKGSTYLSLDWLSFTVDNSVLGDDAIRRRICLHHLELHCPHATSHKEQVAFVDGPVCFQEVGFQIHLWECENMGPFNVFHFLPFLHFLLLTYPSSRPFAS